MSLGRCGTSLCVVALLGAACKGKDKPQLGSEAARQQAAALAAGGSNRAATDEDDGGPVGGRARSGAAAAKTVTATPLTKKDAKPSAAANGHNRLFELPTAGASPPAPADDGRLSLRYVGDDSEVRRLVRDAGVFERIIPQLDQALRLPRDIAVVFDACDEVNAFYDPETATITLCDEYVDYYGELFSEFPDDEIKDAIVGPLVSTLLHELGHALIHQLDLPAVGREEDAVDQLASVVLIASGDEGNAMALYGAYSFIAEAEADGDSTPFWDEHSLDEQRFYNSVCLIYGSDPDRWDDLVGDDDLPAERAERCPDEYRAISTSWSRLLQPFLTVAAMQVRLPSED